MTSQLSDAVPGSFAGPRSRPRLGVVMPVAESADFLEKIQTDYDAQRLGVQTGFWFADGAPQTIQTIEDAVAAEAGVVRSVRRAASEGADAVLVACFSDPGVTTSWPAAGVPVYGEGRPTIAAVGAMFDGFSILSAATSTIEAKEQMVADLGLSDRLHSIVGMDIPILELNADKASEIAALVAERGRLGASAVILGCTGFRPGFTAAVRRELDTMPTNATLIDPAEIAGRAIVAAAISSGALA